MDIAGLRVRIIIQRNGTVTDRYGNHTSAWTDYFSCWATATMSGKSADETQEAGHTEEAGRLDITVRWSSETAAVNSKQYRILLDGGIYDILGIDDMGFRHNSRKFFCRLTER